MGGGDAGDECIRVNEDPEEPRMTRFARSPILRCARVGSGVTARAMLMLACVLLGQCCC